MEIIAQNTSIIYGDSSGSSGRTTFSESRVLYVVHAHSGEALIQLARNLVCKF